MPYTLQIEFRASLESSSLVARILNLKEVLYREFHNQTGVELVNPKAVDVALEPMTIRVRSKRFLGAATKFIAKAVEHEGLQETVVITRSE